MILYFFWVQGFSDSLEVLLDYTSLFQTCSNLATDLPRGLLCSKGAFVQPENFVVWRKIVLKFSCSPLLRCLVQHIFLSGTEKKNELIFLAREDFDFL